MKLIKNFKYFINLFFKKNTIKIDPFILNPVKSNNFFYRENEIFLLSSAIFKNECCSIIGNRRIGKTSLLLHFIEKATIEKIYNNYNINLFKFKFLYIDVSTYKNIDFFWDSLTKKLILILNNKNLYKFLLNKNEFIFDDFKTICDECLKNNQNIVLLFDEFEKLIENTPEQNLLFFKELRSLNMHSKVSIITSTRNRLYRFIKENTTTSPLLSIFNEIILNLFSETDAINMLNVLFQRKFIQIESDEINSLLRIAGPFPFFLQQAGRLFFNKFLNYDANKLIDSKDKKNLYLYVKHALGDLCKFHYEVFLEVLSDEEKTALKLLASGNKNKNEISEDVIKSLINQALIRKVKNRFIIFSESFRDFILKELVTD